MDPQRTLFIALVGSFFALVGVLHNTWQHDWYGIFVAAMFLISGLSSAAYCLNRLGVLGAARPATKEKTK